MSKIRSQLHVFLQENTISNFIISKFHLLNFVCVLYKSQHIIFAYQTHTNNSNFQIFKISKLHNNKKRQKQVIRNISATQLLKNETNHMSKVIKFHSFQLSCFVTNSTIMLFVILTFQKFKT